MVFPTHAYVAVHGNGEYASCNENNRLLDMMHEVDQGSPVTRLCIHPVGLENRVGQLLGIVYKQITGIAKGKSLQ